MILWKEYAIFKMEHMFFGLVLTCKYWLSGGEFLTESPRVLEQVTLDGSSLGRCQEPSSLSAGSPGEWMAPGRKGEGEFPLVVEAQREVACQPRSARSHIPSQTVPLGICLFKDKSVVTSVVHLSGKQRHLAHRREQGEEGPSVLADTGHSSLVRADAIGLANPDRQAEPRASVVLQRTDPRARI